MKPNTATRQVYRAYLPLAEAAGGIGVVLPFAEVPFVIIVVVGRIVVARAHYREPAQRIPLVVRRIYATHLDWEHTYINWQCEYT